MKTKYQIEGRWPKQAKWCKVYAAPHRERWPFNDKLELEFDNLAEAKAALRGLRKANAGQYRLVIKKGGDK